MKFTPTKGTTSPLRLCALGTLCPPLPILQYHFYNKNSCSGILYSIYYARGSSKLSGVADVRPRLGPRHARNCRPIILPLLLLCLAVGSCPPPPQDLELRHRGREEPSVGSSLTTAVAALSLYSSCTSAGRSPTAPRRPPARRLRRRAPGADAEERRV